MEWGKKKGQEVRDKSTNISLNAVSKIKIAKGRLQ
jgi:hypothetical protein